MCAGGGDLSCRGGTYRALPQAAAGAFLLSPGQRCLRRPKLTDFQIDETIDSSGASRLVLLGELDVATSPGLGRRLSQLAVAEQRVVVDLSRVSFMDCTGLAVFINVFADARKNGWRLEIDPSVSSQVAYLIEVAGVGELFWADGAMPAHARAPPPRARVRQTTGPGAPRGSADAWSRSRLAGLQRRRRRRPS